MSKPNRLVQNQQERHSSNVVELFKINDQNNIWHHGILIFNFEQVNHLDLLHAANI